jgi:hypothetical protein
LVAAEKKEKKVSRNMAKKGKEAMETERSAGRRSQPTAAKPSPGAQVILADEEQADYSRRDGGRRERRDGGQ